MSDSCGCGGGGSDGRGDGSGRSQCPPPSGLRHTAGGVGAGEVITLYSDTEVSAGPGVSQGEESCTGEAPFGGGVTDETFAFGDFLTFYVQLWGTDVGLLSDVLFLQVEGCW